MEKYLIYDFKSGYGREPIIRKTKNGTLLCICLSGGNWEPENANVIKIQKSFDDGKTWTEFKQTDIPNPNTKVTLVKANDLILLINNFNNTMGFKNRTHLQIWISKDGENFYKQIKLEEDNNRFFYPHAFFDDEKQILYVAYENSKQFWLKKIPFKDISKV